MNIRKPTDYTTVFATLDTLMAAQLPQMELYREIAEWSAAEWRKARLSRRRNTFKRPIPQPRASLPAICAGCGRFTQPTRNPLKSCGWRWTSAGRGTWRF